MSSSYIRKRPIEVNTTPVATFYYNTLAGTTWYNSSPVQEVWLKAHNSVNTPNWKSVRKLHKSMLPRNPFSAYGFVRSDPGSTVSRETTGFWQGQTVPVTEVRSGKCKTWCTPVGDAINSRPDTTRVQQEAIAISRNQALSRVKDSKVNLGQAFAERRQTANLLLGTVNRLASFALMIRKGKFSAAKQILISRHSELNLSKWPRDLKKVPSRNVFGNLWLEYSYGWRPLLGDIYGAAELLAETVLQNRPLTVIGKGGSSDRMGVIRDISGMSVGYSSRWSASAKTEIQYAMDNDLVDLLKRTGLTDPALLAWELLPYSFVVDWVFPVGQYVSNLSATHGLTFRGGYTSCKTTQTSKSYPNQGEWQGFPTTGFAVIEDGVIMNRNVLTSWPEPTFLVNMNLGATNFASALSLLNQVFGRKP